MVIKRAKNNFEDYPSDWPPKEYHVDWRKVTKVQRNLLIDLVRSGAAENEVDSILRDNRELLAASLSFTRFGNHGSWVIPQQGIRPSTEVEAGLKPDYIVGGKSSGGFSWYVIELKGVSDEIFAESAGRLRFSAATSRGGVQLLQYMDYCSSIQSYLRDSLRLTDFREPKGILIMGTENEFTQNKPRERLKAAWDRTVGDRLQIRTYDALLRGNPSWYLE